MISLVPLSSVQFSRSVVSDSLRPHESQYVRDISMFQNRSETWLVLEFTNTALHYTQVSQNSCPAPWGDIKEYLIKVLTLGRPMCKTMLRLKALGVFNRNF